MRKIIFLMILALFISIQAMAETSTTLTVMTEVVTTCNASTSAVSFTGYDGTEGVYGTGEISIECPLDVPYNIALDAGLYKDLAVAGYRSLYAGADTYLQYVLYKPDTYEWGDYDYDATYTFGDSYSGIGTGTTDVINVDGFLYMSVGSVPGGTYTDVVNVTVYF